MGLHLTAIVCRGDDEDTEVCVDIEVKYSPGRPPPLCMNPSSPRYADPGDAEEIDVISTTITSIDGDWAGGVVGGPIELTGQEVDELYELAAEAAAPDLDDDELFDRLR